MNKCQHCRKNNPKHASFCGHCAQSLNENTCPACNKIVDSKLRYCVHCGTSVLQGDIQRSGKSQEDSPEIIMTLIQAQTESNKQHLQSQNKLLKSHNDSLTKVLKIQTESNKENIRYLDKMYASQHAALLNIIQLFSGLKNQGSELSSKDMAEIKAQLQAGQPGLPNNIESLEDTSVETPTTSEPTATITEKAIVESEQDKVQKPENTLGERRELTVLFSDLSGYTAMNEQLDPEDVEDIMQEVIKRGTELVEQYGGIVNLIVGDELVVLFGIPDAHEDDSFRAVTVALNFHTMIEEYSKTIEKQHGIKLDLHTGIHSGMVVTKHQDSHGGKYNITGDTVNTAARLLGAAETGAILISPRVKHSIEGYFNLEKLEAVAMKGKAKKMIPYKVISATGATTRLEASEQKGLTDFIGRKSELEQFALALETVGKGTGQVISIVGDGGIGKSRLIYEFYTTLDDAKFNRVRGVCYEGKSQAYQPFVEILRSIFELNREEDASSVVKMEKSIKQINPKLKTCIPVYCHLLGIHDNKYPLDKNLPEDQLQKHEENALIQLLLDYALLKPVVYTLDDWQFSDALSDATLKRLVGVLSKSSVLVLVNFRPLYQANWGIVEHHTRFSIKPFNPSETKTMVLNYLKVKHVPKDLAALIFDKTAGNAFYIEELCHALIEQEVLIIDGEDAVLSIQIDDIVLPDTMQGILTTRIGHLPEHTRNMVNHAAVIGVTFSHSLLAGIMENTTYLEQAISDAKSADLIEEIQLTPEPIYCFKQALAQAIIHDNLLKKTNAKIHEKVGALIEEKESKNLEEHFETLAWHYSYSKNDAKAVEYAVKAGDKYSSYSASVEAKKYYETAIARLNKQESLSKKEKMFFVDLCIKTGRYAHNNPSKGMFGFMDKALKYATTLKDNKSLCKLYYWLARMTLDKRDYPVTLALIKKCYKLAKVLKDPYMLGLGSYLYGSYYFLLAQPKEASKYMREAGNLLENTSDHQLARSAKSQYALQNALVEGDFETSDKIFDSVIKAANEKEDKAQVRLFTIHKAFLRYHFGHWNQLNKHLVKTNIVETLEEMGAPEMIMFIQILKGSSLVGQGKLKEGVKIANHLVKQIMKDPHYIEEFKGGRMAMTCSMVGNIYLDAGQFTKAYDLVSESVRYAKGKIDPSLMHNPHRVLAASELGKKKPDLKFVHGHLQTLLKIYKENNLNVHIPKYDYYISDYYLQSGDMASAKKSLQKAITTFKSRKMNWWLKKALALEKEIGKTKPP